MANYASYDKLACVAEEAHHPAAGQLHATPGEAMTFEAIEKRIIADLKGRIMAGHGANMDARCAPDGQAARWPLGEPLAGRCQRQHKALSASYDALEAAASFFELQAAQPGFSFASADAAFATATSCSGLTSCTAPSWWPRSGGTHEQSRARAATAWKRPIPAGSLAT